jgi:hypothetical protein
MEIYQTKGTTGFILEWWRQIILFQNNWKVLITLIFVVNINHNYACESEVIPSQNLIKCNNSHYFLWMVVWFWLSAYALHLKNKVGVKFQYYIDHFGPKLTKNALQKSLLVQMKSQNILCQWLNFILIIIMCNFVLLLVL